MWQNDLEKELWTWRTGIQVSKPDKTISSFYVFLTTNVAVTWFGGQINVNELHGPQYFAMALLSKEN